MLLKCDDHYLAEPEHTQICTRRLCNLVNLLLQKYLAENHIFYLLLGKFVFQLHQPNLQKI